ncbi:hypothetical protein GQ44DRAFT_722020 [Phaeosphaeriaceae sp. PMI808]|nr:hypothetical protein GQ44DRAFT_722020 [Phaeosphaeriaceae sp. PMI808]
MGAELGGIEALGSGTAADWSSSSPRYWAGGPIYEELALYNNNLNLEGIHLDTIVDLVNTWHPENDIPSASRKGIDVLKTERIWRVGQVFSDVHMVVEMTMYTGVCMRHGVYARTIRFEGLQDTGYDMTLYLNRLRGVDIHWKKYRSADEKKYGDLWLKAIALYASLTSTALWEEKDCRWGCSFKKYSFYHEDENYG